MAGDPYWNNVVLAMHMDDVGLSDLKGHAVTLNGNAARSSVQSKFGGYSTAFDGTGDYLSLSDSEDWNFGAGDFTIEFWVRPSVISGAKFVLSQRTSNTVNNAIALYVWDTGAVYFDWSTSGSSTTDGLSSAATLVEVNAWYHVAVARSGETMRMYINGSLANSVVCSGSIFNSTGRMIIGADTNGSSGYFNGYIDDLRITKGVARYTGTFPIPTEAFPSTPPQISGTVKDSTGAFVARTVRAYRRSDGILTGSTTSNGTTGAFTVSAYDDTAHFVTAFDSGAENALIFDNITPL